MPINLRMRDLIIEHADLLVESEVPQPLRDFCAHVSSLEITLAAEKGGIREEILIRHPGASYVSYVQNTYLNLKDKQQWLLRSRVTLGSRISKASSKT